MQPIPMDNHAPNAELISHAGSLAANLHEGSRSEYLAQFVFSSFGTSIPVPHQEGTGLDLYCTLLERIGRRAWPRAYYSVQVKTTMDPWVFGSPESVRWLIEHPLPIFLCVVQKAEARILVYHTIPRFAAWTLPKHPNRLELIPGTDTKAQTVSWETGNRFNLAAPILNFTSQEILDTGFRDQVAGVLRLWINYDLDNLFRIRSGIQRFLVPDHYESNSTLVKAISAQGGNSRDDILPLAQKRLKELLGLVAMHYYRKKDLQTAAIYAMTLRHLEPQGAPLVSLDELFHHDVNLHDAINRAFKELPGSYAYVACDALLSQVKEDLRKHGIDAPPLDASSSPPA
jgi:hypothetical protein